MKTTNAQILCVGRLYCDLVFTDVPRLPELGAEVFGNGLSLHAGGGAFITAATCAALDMPSALCATLPSAPFDTVIADELRRNSVCSALCVPAAAGSAPQITVAIAHQGDRAFLTHRSGAAMPPLDLSGQPALRHLHIGELRTLAECPDLVAQARAAGLSVSLDCGWDDDLLDGSQDLASLVGQVDLFLPNAAEAARLRELGLPDLMAPLTVVKDGASGARANDGSGWISVGTTPVPVIDPTGAGDAFNAGFLSAWLENAALSKCLLQGNRCGARAVQHAGGTAAAAPHC